MHSPLRTVFLVLGMIAGSAATADAKSSNSLISQTQLRLTGLGYYTGPTDGVLGPQTAAALTSYQSANGLPVTGTLNRDTLQWLATSDHYYVPLVASNGPAVFPVVRPVRTAWAQAVPNRFAQLAVQTVGPGNYSVTVNGMPVLVANHQPAPLRISQTFSLNNEDAVIVTSYDGNGGCRYRNYLISVDAQGSVSIPQQIGNCSGGYQAAVKNGVLTISFPTGIYATNEMTMWDKWHYSAHQLEHL